MNLMFLNVVFSFFSGDAVRNCPPQTGNVSFGVVTSNIFGVLFGCFFNKFSASLLGRVELEYGATFVVLIKPR